MGGVVLPWVVTLFVYRTSLFVEVLNWTAMVCMGPTNFVIPPLIFWTMHQRRLSATDNNDAVTRALSFSIEPLEIEPSRQVEVQQTVKALPSWWPFSPSASGLVVAMVMLTLCTSTVILNI